MLLKVKYIIDDNGEKTSVVVPVDTWNDINLRYEKLQNKLRVLTGIKDAAREVANAHKKGKKLQKLTDFLNER